MLIYKSKRSSNREGKSFRLLLLSHSIGPLLFVVALANSISLHAQNTFSFCFPKAGYETAYYLIEDSQNSIIAVGTQLVGNNPSDGAIWKIDSNNDTLTRAYDFGNMNVQFTYIEESDTGYLVVGLIQDTIDTEVSNILVLKLNNNLDIAWQKVIIQNYGFESWKFKKHDGYYYMMSSAFQNSGYADPYFMKLNSNFDTVRTYRSGYMLGGQYIDDFMFSKDGSQIYVFGTSFISLPYGEYRDEIVFYDTAFNYLGYNLFPQDGVNGFYSNYMQGKWMTDTTFLMYCNYIPSSDNMIEQCFMEMDTAMNISNRIFIGVPDTNDVGCLTSHTYSFSNPDSIHFAGTKNFIVSFQPDEISRLRIGMLNRQLQPYYMHYYGGDAQYWIEFVMHTRDGGMVIHARRLEDFTYTESDWDAFFLKVNSEGLITGTTATEICPLRTFLLSPNPGSEQVRLSLALPKAELKVFDISGRLVRQQPLHEGENTIQTSGLPQGIYLFSVIGSNNITNSQKWIKQ